MSHFQASGLKVELSQFEDDLRFVQETAEAV